jgi:1-phosphatidylinositol-3-phosphate 5-kinase
MTPRHSNASRSPADSSTDLRLRDSRRASTVSHASHASTSQDSVAKTLDQIHTVASRTDTLTTFDFATPPRPPSSGDIKGLAGDIVQGGLSGLYSRIRATVGGRDVAQVSPGGEGASDTVASNGKQKLSISNQSLPGGMMSPRNASGPSSRLQSPSTTTFAENLPQASPSTPSHTGLVSSSSAHSQRQAGSEQGLAGEHGGPQHSAWPIKSPTSTTPNTQEARRVMTKVSGGTNAPFTAHHEPDNDRPLAAPLTEYTDGQAASDIDRTPRPSTRLKPPDELRPLPSSVSPRRRNTKDRENSDAIPNLVFPVEPVRPPLVQIGPSHLPGFTASRETSVDGDYSSIVSGTKATRRGPPDATNDESIRASYPNIDPQNTSARLRNKVIAKEFWMRDETAKECFYCGEPFSTFRRKHHCRELSSLDPL